MRDVRVVGVFGRLRFWLLACILALPRSAEAAGGISHVFMAHQAIDSVDGAALRNLLAREDNAYTVGACYPDAGYIPGASYGELSHWDSFIIAFADTLKARCVDPIAQAPRQVAFLMGCANHRVSDELFHWVFLNDVAQHDFAGDWQAAHTFGDIGLDMILTVDARLWLTHAHAWYVPVGDLVETYRHMGFHVSQREIVASNALYYFVGLAERIMAPVTYAAFKTKGPWAADHYRTAPGGFDAASRASARYMQALWVYLQTPGAGSFDVPRYSAHVHVPEAAPHPVEVDKALQNLNMHQVQADCVDVGDGGVSIGLPKANSSSVYRALFDAIAKDAAP